jgi:hypothetical protein
MGTVPSPFRNENDFVAKQLYQVKDAKPLLMDIARGYRENEDLAKGMDSIYGSGSAKYMGDAIEALYTRPGFFE